MKTIAIKVPEVLLDKIQRTAKRRGETRSTVMREALEDFFAEKGRSKSGSCFDLARDLEGCVQGPPDLSTSTAHMDGYGQ